MEQDLYATVVFVAKAYKRACKLHRTLIRLRESTKANGPLLELFDELIYDAELDEQRLRRLLKAMKGAMKKAQEKDQAS